MTCGIVKEIKSLMNWVIVVVSNYSVFLDSMNEITTCGKYIEVSNCYVVKINSRSDIYNQLHITYIFVLMDLYALIVVQQVCSLHECNESDVAQLCIHRIHCGGRQHAAL